VTGTRAPSPPLRPGGRRAIRRRRRRRTALVASAWVVTLAVAFVVGLVVADGARDGVAPDGAPDGAAPDGDRVPDARPDRRTAAGLAPVSVDLAPRTARLVPGDVGANRYVEVVFGDFVASVGAADAFVAQGPGADETVRAIAARPVRGTDDRVLLTFPAEADLDHRARLVVDEGGVRDEYGLVNVPAAVALDGVDDAGRLPGPELLAVAPNATLDRVVFRFDAPVRAPDPAGFGIVGADGTLARGQRVIARGSEQVTVAFAAPVADARRFAVDDGAVQATTWGARPGPAGVVGGATAAPDLVAARRGPGTVQFDFRFDEPVVAGPAHAFRAYRTNGEVLPGRSVVRPSPDVVRVAFPLVPGGADAVALLGVDAGAVRGLAGDVVGTAGTAPVTDAGAGRGPTWSGRGTTSGPDAVGWAADVRTGQVTVRFDERLDATSPDPASFAVVTDAGRRVPARRVVEVDGDTVRLDADAAAVRTAAALVVGDGAVRDVVGDESPVDTLSGRGHHGR